MKVYLAGAIKDCSDDEARGWRDYIKKTAPDLFEFIDPMDRDYRGVEEVFYPIIVEKDKKDIEGSDVVLANCPTPSVGTSMEISTRTPSVRGS